MKALKSMRLHIGIFGKRNVGKSSILNALVEQDISIVSETAGTTTDPVEKSMELLPLGPVLFVDTAGIDDEGALGKQRVEKTKKVIDRIDLAIIICDSRGFDEFEEKLVEEFNIRKTPFIVVINKIDENKLIDLSTFQLFNPIKTSALTKEGLNELKQSIIKNVPENFFAQSSIISDLIPPGEVAVLVVPIDKEAPAGRLILPQVQTIRDLLDNDSIAIVTKERELKKTLDNLKTPPAIVVTDSQAFLKVSADVPKSIPLTSFSILFARFKGELNEFVKGTMAIEKLKSGDKILICESCTHHAIGDDIGRVKIPRWLTQYTGKKLTFEHYAGHDFPENIKDYALIIHCGACMTNRREILSRIFKAKQADIPITNYGLTIAYSLGIFERALGPFKSAKLIYDELKE
ncbi:MAG TPA: [FeFe] hydrogenase H-cluster maturation GTPase HydF [Candidatus Gastranaerophilaceae bacterium]|nr:[FeFe] hydrogenase H-cluster maturation GTPase HydF [Candidatus Gastranaerophilaceae bacterium]HPT41056.1 [FeFe] hydrogenase H-cluster maturation GTPase HydF [Candidatus Gastranaerophilaceae bacterium]